VSGGVRFTEQMRGFHTPGAPAYDAGYLAGRRDWSHLAFELTIGTDDLDAVLADPRHRMTATGWVRCKAVSAADLPVTGGEFELFSPGSSPGRRRMGYRLPLDTPAGPMTLLGFKDVGDDRGIDAWPDTTTLFTRLVHGDAGFDAPVAGEYSRGILRLGPVMLARQLTTFRGSPVAIARFGAFFLGQLLHGYVSRRRTEVPP
jgi:hypothetical protein